MGFCKKHFDMRCSPPKAKENTCFQADCCKIKSLPCLGIFCLQALVRLSRTINSYNRQSLAFYMYGIGEKKSLALIVSSFNQD